MVKDGLNTTSRPWDVEGGSSVNMALFHVNGIAVVKAGEPI